MTAVVDGRAATYDYTPNPRQALAHSSPVDELLYGGAAGGGKALALDTPLPTPAGWTTMGDVQPGDVVIGADGNPIRVVGATEVMRGRPCYRVVFSDGSSLIADAGHQWYTQTVSERAAATRSTVESRAARRANRPSRGAGKRPDLAARNTARAAQPSTASTGGVRTTEQIAATATVRGRLNHSIPAASPLELPDAVLPIDPYILGAWLGDGASNGAELTTADQWMLDELTRRGEHPVPYGRYQYGLPGGLRVKLRALGVLNNKHLPASYLRAGAKQRLAVLQGVVDTDGHVAANGRVEVTLTRERLARDVHELALSLGLIATINESDATLNGRVTGRRWRITWTSTTTTALMPRKAERLPQRTRATTGRRYITAVEPIESVPVRCIEVAAADHLYLAGRTMIPTHNSRMGRAAAVLMACMVPNSRSLILRRSFPELEASVIEPMKLEMPPGLATYNEGKHLWRFKNGSIIELGHMINRKAETRYQGAEYQLCVERSTPVLMGDGSWKRIDAVLVGDMVATLQGPRRVTHTHDVGKRPGVRVASRHGATVMSERHNLLTPGGWASPLALKPTGCRAVLAPAVTSPAPPLGARTLPGSQRSGQPRETAQRQPTSSGTDRPGTPAWSEDEANGCGESGATRPAGRRPLAWSVPAVLYGPPAPSGAAVPAPPSGAGRARTIPAVEGCPAGCEFSPRPGGAPHRQQSSEGGPASLPSPSGADGRSRACSQPGDRAGTRGRTPAGPVEYAHPYTSERVVSLVDAHHDRVTMSPVGEVELWDLTVEGANHYVTHGQLIVQNCVMEEATLFEERQYRYIRSRLRDAGPAQERMRSLGLRPRIICTANPGGVGHHWVKARFIDPAPPETPFREKPTHRNPHPGVRLFIPAKVTDNPYLANDPAYMNILNDLPDTLHRALRDGDWDVLEGVRFPDFSRNVHVIRPGDLPIPSVGAPRAVGVDYGQAAPFAAVWGAKFRDDLIVVYREAYRRNLTPRQQADLIRSMEEPTERRSRSVPIALDPACWARGVNQPGPAGKGADLSLPPPGSIAADYRSVFGGAVEKANNDRISGWARIDSLLRVRPDGAPRILIYDTCVNLIRTLPTMPRDQRNPDDLDTAAEDHACLVGESMVSTPAGDRRIDSLRPGDVVHTSVGPRPVTDAAMTHVSAQVGRVVFSDGSVVEGTADHPVFLADGTRVRLDALRAGDRVGARDGERVAEAGVHVAPAHVRVVSVYAVTRNAPVFNLTVADAHDYYAGGVLVSNCDALRYLVMRLAGTAFKERARSPYEVALASAGMGGAHTITGGLASLVGPVDINR